MLVTQIINKGTVSNIPKIPKKQQEKQINIKMGKLMIKYFTKKGTKNSY